MIITQHGAFSDGKRKFIPWRHFKNRYLWNVHVIEKNQLSIVSVVAKTPIKAIETARETCLKEDAEEKLIKQLKKKKGKNV